ncbi:5-carboxymethyl-2-hydroxymuconate Delta-isomerase [Marimonas lutisalis]|uniref:5-carboxymethyl-2-hydroxymuconate Delta-isomerase n=1 Tax=Marimonas lutisalis TaxID=2545756 RepID=UPI0010F8A556|nr:5-carboxymethyl-2-hydroxymuconate isomerase [Marimonas lutisalis]
MPSVIIQYSEDIAGKHDLNRLCEDLFQALAAHDAVPRPEALKIRTVPCTHWRLGTEPQSFAHADMILLKGRDADAKKSLARTILDVMDSHLPEIGSLSVDVGELDDAYTKRVL